MQSRRCQCGEVCYEGSGQAVGLYICYCRACQKQNEIIYEKTRNNKIKYSYYY